MFERIKSEPAVVAGLVQAVLALLVAFGLDLTGEQIASVLAVTAAGLALFVRSQVTPTRKTPDEQGGTDVLGVALIVLIVVVILILAPTIPQRW